MTIDKFRAFAALHEPGRPVILYNAWDAGSARAVERAGARAIATGSWSVAAAQGYDDGETLPIELALANAARIAGSVALPVTIDFEGGYATRPAEIADNLARLARTGAIGCNLEDRIVGGEGLHPIEEQAKRIAAARRGAGAPFFLNARTDIFLVSAPETHDAAMIDTAIARAAAYQAAGASGLFVPGLVDLGLLARLCGAVTLPVNFMAFPGTPAIREVAAAGVARISHGPSPYRAAMAALTAEAQAAFAWDTPPPPAMPPARPPRRGARTRPRQLQTA